MHSVSCCSTSLSSLLHLLSTVKAFGERTLFTAFSGLNNVVMLPDSRSEHHDSVIIRHPSWMRCEITTIQRLIPEFATWHQVFRTSSSDWDTGQKELGPDKLHYIAFSRLSNPEWLIQWGASVPVCLNWINNLTIGRTAIWIGQNRCEGIYDMIFCLSVWHQLVYSILIITFMCWVDHICFYYYLALFCTNLSFSCYIC